jgi:putative membrane-bound dehydrogenase-like protein
MTFSRFKAARRLRGLAHELRIVVTVAALALAVPMDARAAGPLSPAESQAAFQLADSSLRIELAAAEPDVIDPVAIRFDEDGRMWVVEMRDYPLGPPAGGMPLSRIRVLEDRDGDGRYEAATTFAENLSFVTGLQPWKGGVFVTLAGRVAYMKDTDGDGQMDLDETWFEGFAEQNSQLRANHPRLALDNHIYVANGLRGGKVVNRRLPDEPVIDISGMDFRFDPHTGKAEAVSGNGQFGLCFDDWGNRFTCSNRNPCRHVVIEDRYLRASPGVTVPAVMHDVAAFAENSRIYPISRAWTTSNLHAGQFTAACGVYIYRGDLLPAEFKGNVFTCDPTGNLIHREIMQPAGPTFTSKPAYEGKEFLASPDEWFRPVNLELGPDGALYVVDMYRCVIEHPDFVPDELKQRPDQRLGDDRGRIWRIVPKDANPKREQATADTNPTRKRGGPLSKASSTDLVKLLEHASAWQRETAQRLLVEGQKTESLAEIKSVAKDGREPLGRLHAFWTLQGLNALDKSLLGHAKANSDRRVGRHGLLLCELSEPGREMLDTTGLHDGDRQLRFQSQLSLLMATNPPLSTPLTDAEFQHLLYLIGPAEDPWEVIALLMLLRPDRTPEFAQTLLSKEKHSYRLRGATIDLLERVAELSQTSSRPGTAQATVTAAVAALSSSQPELGVAALAGMSRRWARGQGSPLDAQSKQSLLPAAALLPIVRSDKQTPAMRAKSIALLAYAQGGQEEITRLTAREQDQSVRVTAIGALARLPETDHWQPLLDGFASDTPAARRAILDGMLANAERTKLLLDAIEAGQIKPSELDPLQAKRMLESRDGAIKQRAGKLFAAATPEDRVQALADYQPVLAMQADAARGRAVFEKNCAACHKIGDLGVNVAPDISDSRTKTAAQLLADIIQPNRAIDNNYLSYSVRLVDGTVASGILTTETATSVTLRQQGGKDLTVLRTEIDELRSSGVSLMPEGLERQIPQQDMADLLSFIKNWRYLDGKTPVSLGR